MNTTESRFAGCSFKVKLKSYTSFKLWSLTFRLPPSRLPILSLSIKNLTVFLWAFSYSCLSMLHRHKSLEYARFQGFVHILRCNLKWGFLLSLSVPFQFCTFAKLCQPQAFPNHGAQVSITVCSNLVQRAHVASGINAMCLSCNCASACTSNPLPLQL